MNKYTVERNSQILISVLKANGIRKVVVSPGTTNISLVTSMLHDGSFEMYSAVDERGAAYIACGLSAESEEPVVITCTGATASRNYYPALTEAFHRKLPILAVTASQDFSKANHLSPQYIDRTEHPKDSLRLSVQVPVIRNKIDEHDCMIRINTAVLELYRHGGGPVHINLATEYSNDFSVNNISDVRILRRYTYGDNLPSLSHYKKIAIIVGSHKKWKRSLTQAVDDFCAFHDGVVIVDHSSHYWGEFRVLPAIITCQEQYQSSLFKFDLLIHIGEEHADYYTCDYLGNVKEVWRVSEDGEIRDTYGKLTYTFEMTEEAFFKYYNNSEKLIYRKHEQLDAIRKQISELYSMITDLPFSNIWVAQQMISAFPESACLELGVSNTMRSWTFFDFPKETYVLANTGCRGIDGAIPTLLGMSLADKETIHYAVMGDLTFFYSLNVLGNRNIGNNFRILLINNGCGAEFNLYQHRAYIINDGDSNKINEFIAAGGHAGKKSKELVKHYAQDLGFKYIAASSKNDFIEKLPEFMSEEKNKPIIFELFTDIADENCALKKIRNLKVDNTLMIKKRINKVLGR